MQIVKAYTTVFSDSFGKKSISFPDGGAQSPAVVVRRPPEFELSGAQRLSRKTKTFSSAGEPLLALVKLVKAVLHVVT